MPRQRVRERQAVPDPDASVRPPWRPSGHVGSGDPGPRSRVPRRLAVSDSVPWGGFGGRLRAGAASSARARKGIMPDPGPRHTTPPHPFPSFPWTFIIHSGGSLMPCTHAGRTRTHMVCFPAKAAANRNGSSCDRASDHARACMPRRPKIKTTTNGRAVAVQTLVLVRATDLVSAVSGRI